MDYSKWSQEYLDEAEKILRNIKRLKQKLETVPINEKRSTEDKITQLRFIYYECMQTAAYLASVADKKASHAA